MAMESQDKEKAVKPHWAKLILQNITVEPLLLLYALGFSSGQNIAQPFYMSKICEASDSF